MNPSSAAKSAPNCKDTNLLDIINPAWVSPQRSLSLADRTNLYQNHIADDKVPQLEFTNGYEDDVMIEVEGVVVDSHVAAIDTPTNHTHGAKHDIPRVHHDWNLMVALDKKYQHLMTDANMMEGGVMELEWELADHLECAVKAPPIVGDVCLQ